MSKRDSTLTQERLKQLLHYDPDTGLFTRLVQSSNFIKIGDVAGSTNKGRIIICVNGGKYFAHHLAWLYVIGQWPKDEIDHKDTDALNNRWLNLREATSQFNKENQKRPHKNNKCGFLGVIKSRTGKWIARIIVARKAIHIGTFATPEEAHEAYVIAKRRLHEGCTI